MTTITRRYPTRDMWRLRNDVGRLMNELSRSGRMAANGNGAGVWVPAVDVYENEHALVFKVELPGCSKDDVQVEVKDNILTLKGERKQPAVTREERYHQIERSYGAFQRAFVLPVGVDAEKATAILKDGVLELTLPKAEAAKPKHVGITG